jgi:hypothetical protein
MELQRRGWLITPDGEKHELPETLLDEETLHWPLGLDEVKPGVPVQYLTHSDLYRRHELVPGRVFFWTKPAPAKQLTSEEIERITGVKGTQ